MWRNVSSRHLRHCTASSEHLATRRRVIDRQRGRWEVPTTFDEAGGETSPSALKRSVATSFPPWWPDCALHRVHIGHLHIRRPHCTERRMVQHWASHRPNRRYQSGGPNRVLFVESTLATWSSTLMCIITIYNAEMDDKAHPRNVLDAMGPTLCSSSRAYWPTHRHHHGCTTK